MQVRVLSVLLWTTVVGSFRLAGPLTFGHTIWPFPFGRKCIQAWESRATPGGRTANRPDPVGCLVRGHWVSVECLPGAGKGTGRPSISPAYLDPSAEFAESSAFIVSSLLIAPGAHAAMIAVTHVD
jgi:hypothetical protein